MRPRSCLRLTVGFAVLWLALPPTRAQAAADPQCERSPEPKLDGLSIWAQVDKHWDATVRNPLVGLPAGSTYHACWLTREQAATPTVTCATAQPVTGAPREFVFGYCRPDGTAGTIQWTDGRFEEKYDLAKAGPFVVRFAPTTDGPREVPAYLRIERVAPNAPANQPETGPAGEAKTGSGNKDEPKTGAEKKTENTGPWHFSVHGWVPPHADRRFKLDIHAGVSQFSAAGAFADSFAELRLRSELRLLEHCLRKQGQVKQGQVKQGQVKQQGMSAAEREEKRKGSRDRACIFDNDGPNRAAHFLLRSYFDTGLTSSSALKPEDKTVTYTGARSIEVGVGFGAGFSFPLAGDDGDTRRVAIMAVARAGFRTLRQPDLALLPDDLKPSVDSVPFFTSFGVRIQNEGGRFEGAYVEGALGQSDQYVFRKTGRFKLDAYAPFTAPRTVALALRLQLDRYSPLGGSPSGSCPGLSGDNADATCAQLLRRGDVKVSLLAQVDVRKLFNLVGFTQP